jgi:hypothetical protein
MTERTNPATSAETAMLRLETAVAQILRERKVLLQACYEAYEYFDDRADVADGDDGRQEANAEARLGQIMRDALSFAEGKSI